MFILEIMKKTLANTGIKPPQESVFNMINMLFLCALCMSFGSSLLFLCIEANTFEEYANSGFTVSSQTVSIIDFIYIVLRTTTIFRFFENLEDTIQKSKNYFFKKMNFRLDTQRRKQFMLKLTGKRSSD